MNDRDDRPRRTTRPEVSTSRTLTPREHLIAATGMNSTAGVLAAGSWLSARRLVPIATTWEVEIALDAVQRPAPTQFDAARDTRFHLNIYAEEWGFFFCHGSRASWVRVTDIPFVHGRDDHQLLDSTPPLKSIGAFVRQLEQRYKIQFQRAHASIVTSIPNAEPLVRAWIVSL